MKGDGGARQILVSVNDVTSRVLLARELKESQSSNSIQMDMLLGILRVEPRQLVSFLSDSDATLKMVNTVLKVPARDDAGFRQKIEQIFREMQSQGRIGRYGARHRREPRHAFEDMLKELRDRPELTGNDFLPLLVRLDDLFAHFKTVRELIDQLDGLRAAAQVGAIVSGGTMAVQAMDVSRVLMQRPVQDVTSGLDSRRESPGSTARKCDSRSAASSSCRATSSARSAQWPSSSSATRSSTGSRTRHSASRAASPIPERCS